MSSAADRIELRGLRLVGIVGVLPEERTRAQPLEVDLDLHLDVRDAGRSDALGDTVDYGAVCELVADVVEHLQPQLLERLCEVLAERVLAADGRIDVVDVSVRKLRPPVPQQLASSGVRVRRGRSA